MLLHERNVFVWWVLSARANSACNYKNNNWSNSYWGFWIKMKRFRNEMLWQKHGVYHLVLRQRCGQDCFEEKMHQIQGPAVKGKMTMYSSVLHIVGFPGQNVSCKPWWHDMHFKSEVRCSWKMVGSQVFTSIHKYKKVQEAGLISLIYTVR